MTRIVGVIEVIGKRVIVAIVIIMRIALLINR